MLERIKLINFQSHRNSVLDLHGGVNIIVGTTDSGKSGIMRGIVWAAFNRPNGYAFITSGEKKAEVELKFDDGEVCRTRTKNVNGCRVNGVELKAFGQKIIPEVQEVVRLDDVNVQSQMDAPYLLSLSAPEVARRLNQVANLEEIDKAIKEINSMFRTAASTVSGLEHSLETMDEQLDLIGDLSRMERRWKRIVDIDDELLGTMVVVSELEGQLSDYDHNHCQLDLIGEFPDPAKARATADQLQEAEQEVRALTRTLEDYEMMSSKLASARTEVNQLEKKYAELKPKTCPTCGGKWK